MYELLPKASIAADVLLLLLLLWLLQVGLIYFEDLQHRIPRAEIAGFEADVREVTFELLGMCCWAIVQVVAIWQAARRLAACACLCL